MEAISLTGADHDNKENVPPSIPKIQTRLSLSSNGGKKKNAALSNGRQRQPLADITNLVNCRIIHRTSSVPDINILLVPAVVNSRKRRAVDDIDALRSTGSKSWRMDFR